MAVSTGFTALHTVPELALGGDDQVLMERIGRGGDLDPFAPVVITKNVVRQVWILAAFATLPIWHSTHHCRADSK